MTLGERIKMARNKKGLSQAELARVCDLTQHTICYYERDEWEPSLFNMTSIAVALDVSLDWLVGRTEVMK